MGPDNRKLDATAERILERLDGECSEIERKNKELKGSIRDIEQTCIRGRRISFLLGLIWGVCIAAIVALLVRYFDRGVLGG